jgi:hypothetical protein
MIPPGIRGERVDFSELAAFPQPNGARSLNRTPNPPFWHEFARRREFFVNNAQNPACALSIRLKTSASAGEPPCLSIRFLSFYFQGWLSRLQRRLSRADVFHLPAGQFHAQSHCDRFLGKRISYRIRDRGPGGGADRCEAEPDYANAIAPDGAGNAYIAGATASPDFPVTSGGNLATAPMGQSGQRSFVTKLDPNGNVVFSDLLGGPASSAAQAVAVTTAGQVLVSGQSSTAGFPFTAGAYNVASTVNHPYLLEGGAEFSRAGCWLCA